MLWTVCRLLLSSGPSLFLLLYVVGGGIAVFICFLLYAWRLLLLGDDIERNPGPSCRVCGKRCGGRGPVCSHCGGNTHLGCSGLGRTDFYGKEGLGLETWVGVCCRTGRAEVSTTGESNGTGRDRGGGEGDQGPSCRMCGKRCGGRGPRCSRCGGWTHLACSGMRRAVFYSQEGQKEGTWIGICCRGNRTEDSEEGGSKSSERRFPPGPWFHPRRWQSLLPRPVCPRSS